MIPLWNDIPLNFHLDHINGDHQDDRRSNLRFICPNCHSQTSTYCGKKHKRTLTNSELLHELIQDGLHVTNTLKRMGRNVGSSNRFRCKKLIEHYIGGSYPID